MLPSAVQLRHPTGRHLQKVHFGSRRTVPSEAAPWAAASRCAGGLRAARGVLLHTRYPRRFTFTFTLLLLQCATNMIGAVVGQLLHGPPPNPGIPPSAFIQPAASYITAMMTSNEALKCVV